MDDETLIEFTVEDSIDVENTTDNNTDYSLYLQEIISNQETIITQTEILTTMNNNLITINENMYHGMIRIFYLNGMLFIIALLAIISRYIMKIF